MTTLDAVDIFAGPGGWDVGARDLGITTLGIEFDAVACQTRRAAHLPTVEGDVRDFGPSDFPGVAGLIASPPCQTFSYAGKGAGRASLDEVLLGVKTLAARQSLDWSVFSDVRTGLVLEPLRWVLEAVDLGIPYRWLAFEQVPPILPVWEATADVLLGLGYSVATGNLQAEQYGVPQTRKRAVLIASLDHEVALPKPTHSKYYARNPERLDEGVLPWVSMAEALDWANGDQLTMRSNYGTGGDASNRGERAATQPAPTVTSKIDRNKWLYRTSTMPNATLRGAWQPAPTIAFGHDAKSAGWCSQQNVEGSIRVSVEEAACLQSFPDRYPWQGGKGKQFQQIGNAIPPLLAQAILSALTLRALKGL